MEAADPDYSPDESKLKFSLESIGILPGRKPSHLIVVSSTFPGRGIVCNTTTTMNFPTHY